MAYYDTYNNVQFLDLSGVDEEEKKWILTSLQGISPYVEGPWTKDSEMMDDSPTSPPDCTIQTNINNGIPAMQYEQYPSPPLHVRHVSPIATQVYPQTYPAPIPMYAPPAFVPQVQYAAPIMPMVPVNASMLSFGGQPVTYAAYQPPIQAGPIYNMPPVIKPSQAKMSMNPRQQTYHIHHNDHQEYHMPQPQPQQMPVQQPQLIQTTHSPIPPSNSYIQPQSIIQQPPQQLQRQPSPIANGPARPARPARNPSPVEATVAQVAPPTPQQTPLPVVANGHIGHDAAHAHVHTNGIASDAASPTSTETLSGHSSHSETHISPSTASDTAPPAQDSGAMSWASLLFNKEKKHSVPAPERLATKTANNLNARNAQQAPHDAKSTTACDGERKKSPLAEIGDPNYYRMGEVLVNYTPDNKITSLQPRGLINRSNYCYINSILQALLACPPMYNLLHSLGLNVTNEHRKHTQIIDSVVKFVKEFNLLPAAQRVGRRSEKVQKKEQNVVVTYDRPFEPTGIYKMLNGMRGDSFVVEGRQEDAEEFLGCLLNGLNDEMLELMKLVGAEARAPEPMIEDGYKSESDKEWQVIGPKNKGCITRRTEIVRTPISDIFGGHIRSKLHRTGDQITNNIQPFFTLQLNIEKVATVREALDALVSKNQLEGVTSSKTNEEVEAWQQVTIEELPVVLVLHLKCFDFKMEGCTKIVKALEFPVDLKIDAKLLSQKTNYQPKEKQYKLFAVVYHDGKEATKGHYLTDAYHVGYASWLRFDDSSVKTVQEEQVLKPHGTRVPYLLFYRRCDTVRNK